MGERMQHRSAKPRPEAGEGLSWLQTDPAVTLQTKESQATPSTPRETSDAIRVLGLGFKAL